MVIVQLLFTFVKACVLILVSPVPIVTFFSLLHWAKAYPPTTETLFPMVTVVSFFLPLNALAEMEVTR